MGSLQDGSASTLTHLLRRACRTGHESTLASCAGRALRIFVLKGALAAAQAAAVHPPSALSTTSGSALRCAVDSSRIKRRDIQVPKVTTPLRACQSGCGCEPPPRARSRHKVAARARSVQEAPQARRRGRRWAPPRGRRAAGCGGRSRWPAWGGNGRRMGAMVVTDAAVRRASAAAHRTQSQRRSKSARTAAPKGHTRRRTAEA